MKPGRKIAVLIPWFGPWPGWGDYFFLSCMRNPAVDWIFPTDAPPPRTGAENLKFVPYTLQDFNKEAGMKTGLDLALRFPYKVCDFKPAYGHIFSDLIKDYEFWGYGDLDLVYGDIGDFITDPLLDKYDIISNHPDFITGHFCLLRNTLEIRKLYATGGSYRKAFTSTYYTGFDEQLKPFKINPDPRYLNGQQKRDRDAHRLRYRVITELRKVLPAGIRFPRQNKSGMALKDFSSIVKNAESNGLFKVSYRKTFESDLMLAKQGEKDWKITWKEGSLLNGKGRGILYFHFMLSKASTAFRIAPFTEGLSEFHITTSGISC